MVDLRLLHGLMLPWLFVLRVVLSMFAECFVWLSIFVFVLGICFACCFEFVMVDCLFVCYCVCLEGDVVVDWICFVGCVCLCTDFVLFGCRQWLVAGIS